MCAVNERSISLIKRNYVHHPACRFEVIRGDVCFTHVCGNICMRAEAEAVSSLSTLSEDASKRNRERWVATVARLATYNAPISPAETLHVWKLGRPVFSKEKLARGYNYRALLRRIFDRKSCLFSEQKKTWTSFCWTYIFFFI